MKKSRDRGGRRLPTDPSVVTVGNFRKKLRGKREEATDVGNF